MVDSDNSEDFMEPALDAARQQQAREYARIGRYLSLVEMMVVFILLALLVFAGLSKRLAGSFNLPLIPTAIVYFLILVIAYRIIIASISYYRGYVLPGRYGLSKQSLSGWLRDLFKASALMLLLGTTIVAIVYWLIIVQPQLWWLFSWAFFVLFSLIMSVLAPVILVPIFFKMKPLTDGELRQKLAKLAEKAGVEIGGIYTIEFSSRSTKADAALMGMGRTRRIVLSDTLLSQYSTSEIEVIMAHEMAHNYNRDMLRLSVFHSAILLVNLYVASLIMDAVIKPLGYTNLADVSALPLLALVFAVVNLPLSPITTGYGRRLETEADGYALELTDDPASFISAMARLTDQNLAEAEPNRWIELLFHDHPSYRSRLVHAGKFAESKRG